MLKYKNTCVPFLTFLSFRCISFQIKEKKAKQKYVQKYVHMLDHMFFAFVFKFVIFKQVIIH